MGKSGGAGRRVVEKRERRRVPCEYLPTTMYLYCSGVMGEVVLYLESDAYAGEYALALGIFAGSPVEATKDVSMYEQNQQLTVEQSR